MRRRSRRPIVGLIGMVALLVSIVALPVGCSHDDMSGTLTEAGSTTVKPVADKLARAFMDQYPRVEIRTEGGGSGYGVAAVADGSVDIGAASRDLKPDEPDLVKHLLGRDGIAIVVHPSNLVSSLSSERIIGVFSGAITDWSEIGGPARDILLVSREEGSGTRTAFEEMVMGETPISETAIDEPGNPNVRTLVATTPSAIGYLSIGHLDPTVKAIMVDGIPTTMENCLSGEYPVVRPLYFLTDGEPEGLAKAFIEYALSAPGQSIVEGEGFLAANQSA